MVIGHGGCSRQRGASGPSTGERHQVNGHMIKQDSRTSEARFRPNSSQAIRKNAARERNARFDKLNAFWRRWANDPHYSCLIPLTAFAEAVGTPGKMTRTWLLVSDAPIFAWAGLWRPSEEWSDCYTGVMTENAPELAHIHDRSPVILDREHWHTWLTAPLAELYQFDRPYPAECMAVEATLEPLGKR
jgi:putative SOS response-associated peptidase YedK